VPRSLSELAGIAGISPTAFDPHSFINLNGAVLFAGSHANSNIGLWETNGTAAGAFELTGIAEAAASGRPPADLTVCNDAGNLCNSAATACREPSSAIKNQCVRQLLRIASETDCRLGSGSRY
jgi:ELWxxDGT repeat protein